MEFIRKLGKDFAVSITEVIELINRNAMYQKNRPLKQMIERLNLTYKASYRHTNGLANIDATSYDLALWAVYYNFLCSHKHTKYQILNKLEILDKSNNMPGKW